ncbi:hypothetical protein, partial [Bacillus sp. ABP14]
MKRNLLSKVFILNLFFMCFFISIPSIKAEWDTKKPVLKNIIYSKEVVKPGESIDMYIDAEDTDSGIKSIAVSLINPSKNKTIYLYDFRQDEKGRWVTTTQIPEVVESGEWTLEYIVIEDHAGNQLKIFDGFDKYLIKNFIVDGQDKWDIEKPVLKNITYSKEIVKPGESIDMYIDAEDTDSGIKSIAVSLINPSKNKTIYLYDFRQDEKGRWVTTT